MIPNSIGALSALALDLHRTCREERALDFRAWALEKVRSHISFDCGHLASGRFEPAGTANWNPVLVNRTREKLAEYECVNYEHPLFCRTGADTGIAYLLNDVAESKDTSPQMAAYMRRCRIVHAMACHTVDPLTQVATAIALWREDRAAPFSEDERLFLENLMPHLIETCAANRIMRMERAAHPGGAARSMRSYGTRERDSRSRKIWRDCRACAWVASG